jgi:hypothetical protein
LQGQKDEARRIAWMDLFVSRPGQICHTTVISVLVLRASPPEEL